MATYLGTHGSKIQNYTTDPDNPNTGEVWYNDTDNVLKFQYPNTAQEGSWATGNVMNRPRYALAGAGIQTAALAFGGNYPPGDNFADQTELYDGTNWTEVSDLNTGRQSLAGTGTSTSALAYGGLYPSTTVVALTESWSGSSWTEVGDLNTARVYLASSGVTAEAALAFGGEPNRAINEEWNGSAWTEVGDLNTGRRKKKK